MKNMILTLITLSFAASQVFAAEAKDRLPHFKRTERAWAAVNLLEEVTQADGSVKEKRKTLCQAEIHVPVTGNAFINSEAGFKNCPVSIGNLQAKLILESSVIETSVLDSKGELETDNESSAGLKDLPQWAQDLLANSRGMSKTYAFSAYLAPKTWESGKTKVTVEENKEFVKISKAFDPASMSQSVTLIGSGANSTSATLSDRLVTTEICKQIKGREDCSTKYTVEAMITFEGK